jgi:very-short-patch-repair endonuclease
MSEKKTKKFNPPTVIGKKVDEAKIQRAKQLRKQMTEEEVALWQRLRANQLNGFHFRRQQIIEGFIVDFYCHAAKLVVEVDGEIHEQQIKYDEQRDKVLLARGLQVLRIKNKEVRENLPEVLARIVARCSGKI